MKKANTQQQRQQQHQQDRQQQQQQYSVGNDDLLPMAPPAFPQPLTSLPRNDAAQFFAASPEAIAAAAAAAAASARQRQHQLYASSQLPVSSRAYSLTLTEQQHLLQQSQLQPHTQVLWGPGVTGSAAAEAAYPAPVGRPPAANGSAAPASAAAAVAGVPVYGYHTGLDGLPVQYDAAMAPYAGVVYGASYEADFGVPLLSGVGGFVEDMVFANRQVRHAFLRKVLCLVTLQLLATAAIAAPIHAHKPARKFLHANPWVCGLAAITAFTVLLIAAWSESARRRHATNQLLLALLTAASGLLVGVASATYATPVLLLGLLLAASVSLALVAYASQTSVDFSASGGILYSAVVVLLVVSLANWYLGFKTLHLLVAGCGALLFSAYLVCDVQLLASGDSGYHQVTPDEYVFAAINVYTDVISLFMYVLQVLTQLQGSSEDD